MTWFTIRVRRSINAMPESHTWGSFSTNGHLQCTTSRYIPSNSKGGQKIKWYNSSLIFLWYKNLSIEFTLLSLLIWQRQSRNLFSFKPHFRFSRNGSRRPEKVTWAFCIDFDRPSTILVTQTSTPPFKIVETFTNVFASSPLMMLFLVQDVWRVGERVGDKYVYSCTSRVHRKPKCDTHRHFFFWFLTT